MSNETMHPILAALVEDLTFSGDIRADMVAFLRHHDRVDTAGHCSRVAAEAKQVAAQFGIDEEAATIGGWLHDISVIFPNDQRVSVAESLGVPLLPEEIGFPMIIHQKLSAVLAETLFGVTDPGILSAIGCHTTLKAGATPLDKVVFIADKIAWDQAGQPPYLEALTAGLAQSLDTGVLVYLQFLWDQRDSLGVVHPWFLAAYQEAIEQ